MSGYTTARFGIVGTVAHVSRTGSEIRLQGSTRRCRPMGTLCRIEGTFAHTLIGRRVRLGLNTLGAVVYVEVIPFTPAEQAGLDAVRHLRCLSTGVQSSYKTPSR